MNAPKPKTLRGKIVWFVLKKTVGLRVTEEEEYEGVDIGECGLEAYPEFGTGSQRI